MNKNETKISVIENETISVKDINTRKEYRVVFESIKSGLDDTLKNKKYDLACTYEARDLKGEHFVVHLGWTFQQLSKETQIFLADNEIAHIARGHMASTMFHNPYSRYLNNDRCLNMAADLYIVYFGGHQKYTKELIERVFDELSLIPMNKKDTKMLAFRKEHILKAIAHKGAK